MANDLENRATPAIPAIPGHVPPALVFDFDIYHDARVNDDVQGSYAAALKDAPDIFFTPHNGGHWMVKRYEMITEINKDYEHFSAREMQIPRVPRPPFYIPLSLDPPANLPYRRVMMPMFSTEAIRKLQPTIKSWAVRIIEEIADKGECDFMRDVSSLFSASIFMELMGMPLDRLREFRHLADEFFSAHDADTLDRKSGEIQEILKEMMGYRRASPGPDIISQFLNADVNGRKLSDDEVLAMCFILFLGGMDTVTNVTGFAYQHLAQVPELQQRLASNPDLIPKFVEEALRCFAVAHTPRLVAKDCERFGVQFKAGDMILSHMAMAGRDDRVTDNPNKFDIDRKQIRHLTFSTGPHMCVGHILARAEMHCLVEEWLKRIPRFSATPDIRHGFRAGTVMGLGSLPLRWEPAIRKTNYGTEAKGPHRTAEPG